MIRIVEIAWVVVAALSLVELFRLWPNFDQRFWIFLGCLAVAIFMFFVRRKQRIKMEERQGNQD